MKPALFLTGFPGYLGAGLLPRLLRRFPDSDAVCLVQPRYAREARRRLQALEEAEAGTASRVELVEGDLTEEGLGLDRERRSALTGRTTRVFHLAALYDLEADRDRAEAVNVDGTRRVLALADRCGGLRRFHHVSTCYVSGRHPGLFREEDLDVGQRFRNAYEETKCRAEAAVRSARSGGMPVTVYRPSVVTGDSRTGEVRKADGPVPVIRWILRQPGVAFVPVPGNPSRHTVNLVPRDYVLDSVAYLAGLSESRGTVYQLADPDPPTVSRLLEVVGRAAGRKVVRVPVSRPLLRGALDRVPGLARFTGLSPAMVEYFVHRTHYRTENARRHLSGSGIPQPEFRRFGPRLVAYLRRNPALRPGPMA